MRLYKLTDENGLTRAGKSNACQWGENVTHSGTGKGELCGPGYIHAYTDPLLAVLLNPIHAAFDRPRLWEAAGEIALREHDLKVGCLSLTTVREIPLPEITTEHRIRFGILCALTVYDDAAFAQWAKSYLSGEDKSESAAYAAADAAYAAARAAARAAYAAADAADAAYAAADAAYAAADAAADAAARAAADAAAGAAKPLDLAALARQACAP